jgi:hypothetical protein
MELSESKRIMRLEELPLAAVVDILQQLLDKLDIAIVADTAYYKAPSYDLVAKSELAQEGTGA